MSQQSLQGQVDALEQSLSRAHPAEVPELRRRLTGILRRLQATDRALPRKGATFRSRRAADADEDLFDNMPV